MTQLTYNELLENYKLLISLIIDKDNNGESIDELLETKEKFDQMLGLPEERNKDENANGFCRQVR